MRRAVLVALLLLATGGILVGFGSATLAGGDRLWPLTWLAWAPIGFVILWQRPANRVGWTMLGVGLAWGSSFALLRWSEALSGGSAAWVELANVLLGVLPWLGIILLVLIFPDGRAATLLEKALVWALSFFGGVVSVAFAIDSTPLEATGRPSPLAVPALAEISAVLVSEQSFLVMLALFVLATFSVIRRWRVSRGVERAQYQWLLFGAAGFAVITLAAQFAPEDSAGELIWFLGGFSIPLAMGVAVLRYRLFEIDRIISRTLSYGVVVGLLGALFIGAASALGSVLPAKSPLAVAGSTLAAAALFNPLRKRVQTWVDRRFNRSRFDAQRVMDRFAGSLRGRLDTEELMRGWVGVVAETMQPTGVAVWVRAGQ